MSIIEQPPESFVSLQCAAARLGVPTAWLREEAQANQVPHLRAGRRILFNIETVERALIERAKLVEREVADAR